jgi:hypothetical protein
MLNNKLLFKYNFLVLRYNNAGKLIQFIFPDTGFDFQRYEKFI